MNQPTVNCSRGQEKTGAFHKEAMCSGLRLRHNRQRKIVSIATFVVGFESIAARDEGPAVGEITEGAGNWCRGGVVNYGEDGAGVQSGRAIILEGNRCVDADFYSIGNDRIRRSTVTVEATKIDSAGFKRKRALDSKGSDPSRVSPW